MSAKRNKAEYLFSELSGISDVYINEAMSVRKRRSRFRSPKFLGIAASVAAALVLIILVPTFFLLSDSLKSSGTSFQLSISGVSGETVAEASDIEFFDGEVKLIISEGEGFRTALLPGASPERIIKLMSSGNLGQLQKSEDGQTEIPKVWLSLGDGRVISPYLEYSPGNIGAGVLFDYDPEGEPPKKLTEYISGLLS